MTELQTRIDSGLLPADRNLTQHCAAISALPPEQYAPMLALLLEHGWSVKDTQAAVELGLPILKTAMALRVAYPEALGSGLTVTEMPDTNARIEMRYLVAEIRKLLR